jgi:hypothetical protein
MNTYLRERLRADAAHVVMRARAEELIVHKGLRGRFRELLVDGLLSPWLPPYAGCGTGMIVDVLDQVRDSTQEDIVVFDRSLIPPVLAHSANTEGVFPVDGVLLRIEVKSTLTRAGLRSAMLAAADVYRMQFSGSPSTAPVLPISAVFTFGSDLKGDPVSELERLLSLADELDLHFREPCTALPSPISALCVVGRGTWTWGRLPTDTTSFWYQARRLQDHDEILHFVGACSNTCFEVHANRQGRPRDLRTIGGGIGNLILSSETYEVAPL